MLSCGYPRTPVANGAIAEGLNCTENRSRRSGGVFGRQIHTKRVRDQVVLMLWPVARPRVAVEDAWDGPAGRVAFASRFALILSTIGIVLSNTSLPVHE